MSNQTTYTEALTKGLEEAKRLQKDVDIVRKNGNTFTDWTAQPSSVRLEAASRLAKAIVAAEDQIKLVNQAVVQLQHFLEDFDMLRANLLTVQATGHATIKKALPGN